MDKKNNDWIDYQKLLKLSKKNVNFKFRYRAKKLLTKITNRKHFHSQQLICLQFDRFP